MIGKKKEALNVEELKKQLKEELLQEQLAKEVQQPPQPPQETASENEQISESVITQLRDPGLVNYYLIVNLQAIARALERQALAQEQRNEYLKDSK